MKTKIKKQDWDESVKDTPEYDLRKNDKKEEKLKAKIAKLKAEYFSKFGEEYDTKK
jgi:hypothetical protein